DVDVVLVPFDVRILLAHLGQARVPPGHGNGNAVGLGGAGDVLAALAGQLEGEFQHTIRAGAGEYAFLDHDFALRAFKQNAAAVGVFAFGVLADDEEIDIARL